MPICKMLSCEKPVEQGSQYCEDHAMSVAIANSGSTLGSLADRIRAARKAGTVNVLVSQYQA